LWLPLLDALYLTLMFLDIRTSAIVFRLNRSLEARHVHLFFSLDRRLLSLISDFNRRSRSARRLYATASALARVCIARLSASLSLSFSGFRSLTGHAQNSMHPSRAGTIARRCRCKKDRTMAALQASSTSYKSERAMGRLFTRSPARNIRPLFARKYAGILCQMLTLFRSSPPRPKLEDQTS